MDSVKILSIMTVLSLLACANGQRLTDQENRRIVTRTHSSTVTEMVTTTTTCASLSTTSSSPITACRRRRQYWIDIPVFIAVDDREDELISQILLRPTNILPVEPTAVSGKFRDDYLPDDYVDGSPINVDSSKSTDPFSFLYFQPRVNFGMLSSIVGSWWRPVNNRMFYTRTTTPTTTSTITKTKSFFIGGCTPSPFPFGLCS